MPCIVDDMLWTFSAQCLIYVSLGLSCGTKKREIEKSENTVNLPTGTLRNGKDMLTCLTEHD